MAIRHQQFSGLIPKFSTELLPENNAAVADGCGLRSGKIVPLREHVSVADVPAGTKSIFLHNGVWLDWQADVDVVKSPVVDDEFDRLYWTGDGLPSVSGLLEDVRQSFRLGVPAPVVSPDLYTLLKSSVRWRYEWHYQYEDDSGTVYQEGDLYAGTYEGANVFEVTAGEEYHIHTVPPFVGTLPPLTKFVAYFDVYSTTDPDVELYLGRCYPSPHSQYDGQTTAYLNGGTVSMEQTNNIGTAPEAVFTMAYDTSEAGDYVKERSYVFTFVTAFGEEGAPCDPTGLISVLPTQDVVLSDLPTEAPAGYENIVLKRIYRTVTTAAGTVYQRVGDVDITQAYYYDIRVDAELTLLLDTADWLPPPDGMQGLCVNENGVGAGFTENKVHLSEPYRLHAYPAKFEFQVKSTVVSLKATASGFVVITTDEPEVIMGDTPSTMRRQRIPVKQGGAGKRGAVVFRGGVVYATPDGVGQIAGLGYSDLSGGYYDRANWQALNPAEMLAAVHDNQLLFYSSTSGLIASLADKMLVSDSATAPDAFYQDADNDTLYFASAGKIWKWRGGAGSVEATWQSRTFVFTRPAAPVSAQIQAAGYPVTLNLVGAGAPVLSIQILDSKVRKLPVLRRTEKWAYEVVTNHEVSQVVLGTAGGKL